MKRFIVLGMVLMLVLVGGLVAQASNALPAPRDNTPPLAVTPMAAVQQIITTGLAPSFAAVSTDAAGTTFVNDGRTFVEIKNTSAAIITATFATPLTVGGLAVADLQIQIPATTGDKMIGPFLPEFFNDATGAVAITFTASANVTAAAVKW